MNNSLDQILLDYETNIQNESNEIPRQPTAKEFELLTDYVLNDNLQAIYDYYELKQKLDKDWVNQQMWYKFYPF